MSSLNSIWARSFHHLTPSTCSILNTHSSIPPSTHTNNRPCDNDLVAGSVLAVPGAIEGNDAFWHEFCFSPPQVCSPAAIFATTSSLVQWKKSHGGEMCWVFLAQFQNMVSYFFPRRTPHPPIDPITQALLGARAARALARAGTTGRLELLAGTAEGAHGGGPAA